MMVLHTIGIIEDQVFVWCGMVLHTSVFRRSSVFILQSGGLSPGIPRPTTVPFGCVVHCTLYIVQIPTEYERFPLHRKLWKRCSALEHFDFLSTIFILHQTARADILQLLSPFSTMFTSVNYNQPVYFSQL